MSRSLVSICVGLILVWSSARGQDRDSEFYSDFAPTELASYHLLNSDFVAIGEFGAPVEIGNDPLSLLESRDIDLDFTVSVIYKGPVRTGTVVKVRLRNDMLTYPGSDVSRYQKRWQFFQEAGDTLKEASVETNSVDEALSRGEITQQEASERYRQIDARYSEAIAESRAWSKIQRMPGSSHCSRIDERGGAIRTGEPYLIALNAIDGNVGYYELREHCSPIWWNDAIDELRSEIERLQESSLALRRSAPQ